MDLKKMKVSELKQYAQDQGIYLGWAKRKADIIAVIEANEASWVPPAHSDWFAVTEEAVELPPASVRVQRIRESENV
jgi:hypothetical protein